LGAIRHSGQVIAPIRPRRRGHSSPHGQFFTLKTVAEFLWQVVDLLQPSTTRRAIDLAAGDGVLLKAGCQGGWTTQGGSLGVEIDPVVASASAGEVVRMETGDGLLDGETLLREWQADVVVGNPPFGRSRDLLTDQQRRRLATEATAPRAIWGRKALGADGQFTDPAGSCRVEQLFLERALHLLRDGGLAAYILSDGVLSNRREQVARDWLSGQAHLLAAIALPSSAFRRPGLNALAHLVVLRRSDGTQRAPEALLMERRHAGRGKLPNVLQGMLQDLRRLHDGGAVAGAVAVPGQQMLARRWDPGFWIGKRTLTRLWGDQDTAELNDFIELLTYGPIVTGGQPMTEAAGIASIRQGDFAETGLRTTRFLRIAANGDHDPPRSRVQPGDVLMPRSGGGALGRNRVAVYEEPEPANIGCFVNLIRLVPGLNPYYLWIFLRSQLGWGQIRSLINGVGTPNISFFELRGLKIPVLGIDEQSSYEHAYRTEVGPLHRVSEENPDALALAEVRFQRLVTQLDQRLIGARGGQD
jgi:hypothetical protein